MIVEERISGTLCRLHPDPDKPDYTAQWILTNDGEIKGLMSVGAKYGWVKEFGAWCRQQPGPLRLSTAVHGIKLIMKRFGFTELTRAGRGTDGDADCNI